MEKLVYLTWKREGLSIADYRQELLGPVSAAFLDAGVLGLNISVADTQELIPKPTLLMGEGASVSAAVSVWMGSLDDRRPLEEALRARTDRLDGYLVTESIPQPHQGRDWADGEVSPGVTHFTWFPRPERLSPEAFYHGWHDIHTPSSFGLHPRRWEYVRNAVARVVTPDSPRVDAIVCERFATEDYLDPARLYGSSDELKRTVEELPLYADMDQMHSTPLSEVIVKSLGA